MGVGARGSPAPGATPRQSPPGDGGSSRRHQAPRSSKTALQMKYRRYPYPKTPPQKRGYRQIEVGIPAQGHGVTFPDVKRFLEHEFVAFCQIFFWGTEKFWGATVAAPTAPGRTLDGAKRGHHLTAVAACCVFLGGGDAAGRKRGGDGVNQQQHHCQAPVLPLPSAGDGPSATVYLGEKVLGEKSA